MSNDSTTFVVLGDHHWVKGDYLYELIEKWLAAVHYDPDCTEIRVVRVRAKPEEVSVGGMGDITYPEGREVASDRLKLTDQMLRKWLYKLRIASERMDEAMFEVTSSIHSQSILDEG